MLAPNALNAVVGLPNIGKTDFMINLANLAVLSGGVTSFVSVKNRRMRLESLNENIHVVVNPYVPFIDIHGLSKDFDFVFVDDAWNISDFLDRNDRRDEIVRELAKAAVSQQTCIVVSWPLKYTDRVDVTPKLSDCPLQLASDAAFIIGIDGDRCKAAESSCQLIDSPHRVFHYLKGNTSEVFRYDRSKGFGK